MLLMKQYTLTKDSLGISGTYFQGKMHRIRLQKIGSKGLITRREGKRIIYFK